MYNVEQMQFFFLGVFAGMQMMQQKKKNQLKKRLFLQLIPFKLLTTVHQMLFLL